MPDLNNSLDKAYDEHICRLFNVLCTSISTSGINDLGQIDEELREEHKKAAFDRFHAAVLIADTALKKVRP